MHLRDIIIEKNHSETIAVRLFIYFTKINNDPLIYNDVTTLI